MKDTTTVILGATLYTFLMCGPSVLTARDGNGSPPVDRQPATLAGDAGGHRYITLLPEQLDAVKAGQTFDCSASSRTCTVPPRLPGAGCMTTTPPTTRVDVPFTTVTFCIGP
jgi:hypothetical protein